MPATGARRTPRHGHTEATTWPPRAQPPEPIKTRPEHTSILAPLPSPS
jgi:hypothetical protein